MPDMDRYPELGTRRTARSAEEVLEAVRFFWPHAYAEGSTGFERTWWVRTPDGPLLVGHHWPCRPGTEAPLHVRISDPDTRD